MPARKDLTGLSFGSLTAMWPTGVSKGGIFWLCSCRNCGRTLVASTKSLRNGDAQGRRCVCQNIDGTPEHTLWAGAKQRAKVRGLLFDLKVTDICIPSRCPKLGIPIFPSKRRFAPNSPSIDRKDSSRGYTKDNIQIISWKANRLKSDGTKEDFQLLINNWDA